MYIYTLCIWIKSRNSCDCLPSFVHFRRDATTNRLWLDRQIIFNWIWLQSIESSDCSWRRGCCVVSWVRRKEVDGWMPCSCWSSDVLKSQLRWMCEYETNDGVEWNWAELASVVPCHHLKGVLSPSPTANKLQQSIKTNKRGECR